MRIPARPGVALSGGQGRLGQAAELGSGHETPVAEPDTPERPIGHHEVRGAPPDAGAVRELGDAQELDGCGGRRPMLGCGQGDDRISQLGDVILALISKGAQTEVKSVDQFNMLLAQSDKAAAMTLASRRIISC